MGIEEGSLGHGGDAPVRDSVDIPGAKASRPVTLELVRRLPVRQKGWVWVKVKSKTHKKDSEWKRRYATLRGGVLLLDKLGRNTSMQVEADDCDQWYTSFDLFNFKMEGLKKKLTIELHRTDETLKLKMRLPCAEAFTQWFQILEKEMELFELDPSTFKFVRTVGEGSMGKVFKVSKASARQNLPLAVKILEKDFIKKHDGAMRLAMDERAVLELVGKHPYVLGLQYAIETEEQFAVITEFCERGDLSFFLAQRRQPMIETKARILIAEVALGLEHLHSLGVVYRDLKTENILLDKDGHVRLADFGLAKILGRNKKEALMRRTETLCGTTHYYAPEMVEGEGYSQGVDFWALGVLLHFVVTGRMPYDAEDDSREEIIRKLRSQQADISEKLSPTCRSLLDGLLEPDPEKRIGRRGIEELQDHAFFADLDWDSVVAREAPGIFESFEETRRVHRMVDANDANNARDRCLGARCHDTPGFSYSIESLGYLESVTNSNSQGRNTGSFTNRMLTKVWRTP